ncbi:MAG: hypothetical protein ABIJ09_05560 [Pseudomonadota bacterium]
MHRTAVGTLLLALVACGPTEDAEVDPVPVISDLQYAPPEVQTYQQFDVLGSFWFVDGDADSERVQFRYTFPDGRVENQDPVDVEQAMNRTEGEASFVIHTQVAEAGSYRFEITLLDRAGHASNALGGPILAR